MYLHHNLKNLAINVNIELQKIENWMKLDKLTINYQKSEYMLVSNKKNISEDFN